MEFQKRIESLSPNERKVLPYLREKSVNLICKKSNLDKVSVLRALDYLQNKGIVSLKKESEKVIELGVNGALYIKKGLPERRFINIIGERRVMSMKELQKEAELSDDEFKASLGALKKKALIELSNGKILLSGTKEEISKKTLEEKFIESLPLEYNSLTPEQKFALKSLEMRKGIIVLEEKKTIQIELTELGKKIIKFEVKEDNSIESITPEILKKESLWKGKKFRRYDLVSSVPKIYGGKRHFVNQSIDYARKIWTEMGFNEMSGNMIESSFWVFDTLFTAQDHPVREMQDTFFINKKKEIPSDKNMISKVKESHEKGVGGSKGWNYKWDEELAKQLVLRTHTTAISSKTLSSLSEKEIPSKFFAIGKCFRNETIDWAHGFEFNQTEGIVIDKNANFRHLLGYLKQFFMKMGYEKIRFRPSFFAYTEPSVEIEVWHPEKNIWFELGGAGIFRPEVTIPLFGKHIPVLAWGPGFDRILMNYYGIKDIRELYQNDITQLRNIKFWVKN